jgi:hypothetical protein
MRGAEPVNEINIVGNLMLCPDAMINYAGSQTKTAFIPQSGKRTQQCCGIRTAGDGNKQHAARRDGCFGERGAC